MDRTVNPYLRDAPYFLKRAVIGIIGEKDGAENLSHALDLALGIERVLKGILWKEHPGYTLADERFQNMAAVFRADSLKKIGADKEKGNADSITYRTAATRARIQYMKLAPEKARDAAKWLGTSANHFSHGRPICAKEAADQGLKITVLEEDPELQDLVLSLYHATLVTFESTNCGKLVENQAGKGMYIQIPPPKLR